MNTNQRESAGTIRFAQQMFRCHPVRRRSLQVDLLTRDVDTGGCQVSQVLCQNRSGEQRRSHRLFLNEMVRGSFLKKL